MFIAHILFRVHELSPNFCQVDRETVNVFCFSKLWLAQLTSETPRAIEESEFVVPMASGVSSAEGRRNYTDLQETAQWLGGLEIPKCILKDLLSVGPLASLSISFND